MKTVCFLLAFIPALWGAEITFGQTGNATFYSTADTAETVYIRRFFQKENKTQLSFPSLAARLYTQNNNACIWTGSTEKERKLWDALLLLDCVLQYGLDASDYYPKKLSYDTWRLILSDTINANPQLRAVSDILLTDAVLKFTAHLHYGRQNPTVSFRQLDNEQYAGYRIDEVVKKALLSSNDLKETILDAQPQNHSYKLLQDYLRLMAFQYTGDCYEAPAETLKLIARNLERYKWHTIDDSIYIEINIPAFMLNYVKGDKTIPFRIIAGKPSTPTPVLSSKIRFFTTAPDWTVPLSIFKKELLPKALADTAYFSRNNFALYSRNGQLLETTRANLRAAKTNPSAYFARQSAGCDNALGKIVFNFENSYSVYLHDTPNPALFKQQNRALSHGCIRVENPQQLASLLLEQDKASTDVYPKVLRSMEAYQKFRYTLKKPVPIIIRYITCEVKNGELVQYPDLYKKDR